MSFVWQGGNQLASITAVANTYAYTYNSAGYLTHMTRVAADSTTQIYKLNYDSFGRNTSTEILGSLDLSGITLVTNTYNSKNLLTKSKYGNSKTVTFTYDDVDRLIKTVYNDVDGAYEYVYDSQGRVGIVRDSVNDITTEYFYDLAGRPCEIVATDAAESALLLRTILEYDEKNRLQGYEDTLFGTHSFETEYTYGDPAQGEDPNTVYSISRNGSQLVAYAYDSLGRRISRTLSAGNKTVTYLYEDVDSEHTTFRLRRLDNPTYGWYGYTYNELGYITRIDEYDSDEYATYEYDALGQLIRENSTFENKTYVWTYDGSGNILSKKTYAFTTGALGAVLDTDTYTYGNSTWKDQLTEYNGTEITYDKIGNPLQYRDGMSFVWQAGRQLKSATVNGKTYTYTYNEDGIRTSKTVDGITTEFIISDGQFMAAVRGSEWLYFIYDENGTIVGFTGYSSGYTYTYYYEFNAQGDVVALLNSSGNIEAIYKYDAWGKLLGVYDHNGNLVTSSSHVGIINPIRYRGYFYDEETGFYYLNSRYYDPEVGRFINADGYASTGQGLLGTNMYAYCLNNPVTYYDPNGTCVYMCDGSIYDCGTMCSVKDMYGEYLTQQQNNDLFEDISNDNLVGLSRKRGDGYKRKDKKKGSENRQPTGARERNVGHKEGEEHSRVPKGGKNVHIEVELPDVQVEQVAGVVAVGVIVWFTVKWAVAIATAPATGGGSLALAVVTP